MDAGFCSRLQEQCFAIIGMGLIGGSYAKALRRLGVKNITGVDVNKNALQQALADGVIDRAYENAGAYLAEADVIICCIYPKAVTEFLRQATPFIKKGAVITDVSGRRAACLMRRSSLCRKGRNLFQATRWLGARAMVMICRRRKFLTVPITLLFLHLQTAKRQLTG